MALPTSVATWSVTALGSVAPFAVTSETFNLTLPSVTSRVPFAVMSTLSEPAGRRIESESRGDDLRAFRGQVQARHAAPGDQRVVGYDDGAVYLVDWYLLDRSADEVTERDMRTAQMDVEACAGYLIEPHCAAGDLNVVIVTTNRLGEKRDAVNGDVGFVHELRVTAELRFGGALGDEQANSVSHDQQDEEREQHAEQDLDTPTHVISPSPLRLDGQGEHVGNRSKHGQRQHGRQHGTKHASGGGGRRLQRMCDV